LRHSLTAAAALVALALVAGTARGAQGNSTQELQSKQQKTAQMIGRSALAYYGTEISRFQRQTWHWQRVMGARLTPAGGRRLTELTPTAIQRRPCSGEAPAGPRSRRIRPICSVPLHPPLRGS
jgi:hypothetical protein